MSNTPKSYYEKCLRTNYGPRSFIIVVLIFFVVNATSHSAFGGNQRGFAGGPQGGPQMTSAQRQAFGACLQQQGVTPPNPPQLTSAQQSAMQSCKQQSNGDPSAFMNCAQAQGITPPTPPSAKDKQAFESCASQVMGQSSGQSPTPPPLSTSQQQALLSCLQQQGVSVPQLTSTQQAEVRYLSPTIQWESRHLQ